MPGISLGFIFPKVETRFTQVLSISLTMLLKPKGKEPAGPQSLCKPQGGLTSASSWGFTDYRYCFTVSREESALSLLLSSGGLLAIPGMVWCVPTCLTCRGQVLVSVAIVTCHSALWGRLNIYSTHTGHMDTDPPVPG